MHRLKNIHPGTDTRESKDPIADLFHSLDAPPSVNSNTHSFSQPLYRACHAIQDYQKVLNAMKVFAEENALSGTSHAPAATLTANKAVVEEAITAFQKLKNAMAHLHYSFVGTDPIENPQDFEALTKKNRRTDPKLLEVAILDDSSKMHSKMETTFRELADLLERDKKNMLAPHDPQAPMNESFAQVILRCDQRIELAKQAHTLYLQCEALLNPYKISDSSKPSI